MPSINLGPFALSLDHALLMIAFVIALIVGGIVGRKVGSSMFSVCPRSLPGRGQCHGMVCGHSQG